MSSSASMNLASRNRLMPRHVDLFPGETLFDRLARSVCAAGCLPRKELYESWEMARRVRRRFRGGRIVDWACGHGLLGAILLLLDDASPDIVSFDVRLPPSAQKLQMELCARWPRLAGRWAFTQQQPVLCDGDLVVSCHACGHLTDQVLHVATRARARLAVMPCCHDHAALERTDWLGWIDPSLAMDLHRADGVRAQGYEIWTTTIPDSITPQNRVMLASPNP